jgi:hypothetical protein
MNTLQRAMWWLAAATAFLYLAGGSLGVFLYVTERKAQHNTAKALCTFRNDLSTRVHTTEKFLIDHPQGLDGLIPALLRSSLKNQRGTLNSLKHLDCPPPEVLP